MTSCEPRSSAAPRRQPVGDKRSPRRVTTVAEDELSTTAIAASKSSAQPICDSKESSNADKAAGAPEAGRTCERTD